VCADAHLADLGVPRRQPTKSSPGGVKTQDGSTGRVRDTLSEWRHLALVAYRDREHVCERLALQITENLGDDSLAWEQRVREERTGVPRAVVAEDLRIESARVAAIDGAISGTAFLIALVLRLPGVPQAAGTGGASHRGAV